MSAINSVPSAQSKLKTTTPPPPPPQLSSGLVKKFENVPISTDNKVTVTPPQGQPGNKVTGKSGNTLNDKTIKQPSGQPDNQPSDKTLKTPSNLIPLPKVINDGNTKKTDSPKPTQKQEQKVDEAGAKAVREYKTALADPTKRADLAEAITGTNATKEEKAAVDKHLQSVAKSKDAPKFDVAAVGTAKDIANGNKKLGGEILGKGVDGAFVAKNNTALISEKLITDDGKAKQGLGATVREEAGEWLAASAAKAGLKVGAGDAGNRLSLVLGGDKEEARDDALNTNLKSDKTTVRIGGQTVQAEAAAKNPPAGQVYFRIANMVDNAKVTFSLNGKTNSAQENSPYKETYTTLTVPRGYSGTFTTTAYDYNKNKSEVVTYTVSNLGTANQSIKSQTKGWEATSIKASDNNTFYKVGIKTSVQQRGIWFSGLDSGWKLTIPSGKNNRVVENDSAADWHKSADYIGTALPLGYDGTLKLTKDKTTVEVKVKNYGQNNQQIWGNTKGWSVVQDNKETLRIVNSEAKGDNRQAVINSAQNYLSYMDSFANGMGTLFPVGVKSEAMITGFVDKIKELVDNYTDPTIGFGRKITDMNKALITYHKMGATPEQLKSALNIAAGSTPENGNDAFTKVVSDKMGVLTNKMSALTTKFKENVKDQKAAEKALANKERINTIVNTVGNLATVGMSTAAIGISMARAAQLAKSSGKSIDIGPGLSGIVAQIGGIWGGLLPAGLDITEAAKLVKQKSSNASETLNKYMDNEGKAKLSQVPDSTIVFVDAIKICHGIGRACKQTKL